MLMRMMLLALRKAMGEQVTGERVTVLYGTDTGNAEMVARNFHFEFKRRGLRLIHEISLS